QLADGQVVHAGADLDDLAAERVAERGVGVEPVADLAGGGPQPLLGDRLHDLLDLVGPGPGLADQRQLALADLHYLGAGGDERELGTDQDAARPRGRHRDLQQRQLARLVVLRDLLHQSRPCCRYQTSRVSSCQISLDRSAAPRRSSSIMVRTICLSSIPDVTRVPPATRSSTMSDRSRRIQARSGALNSPLGRYTISLGSQASAACLRMALRSRPTILALPGMAKGGAAPSLSPAGCG